MLFFTFGLWLKSDSSIWTTTPGPPRSSGESRVVSLQLHMSRRYWYACTADISVILASSAVCVTGNCRHHPWITTSHCERESLDFSKKLPCLTLWHFLQESSGHRHLSICIYTNILCIYTTFFQKICVSILHMVLPPTCTYLQCHYGSAVSWQTHKLGS